MTTTYTYDSSSFNYDTLFNDIKGSTIYKSLTEMYRNGDNIYVTFKTLSSGDDDILTKLIASHNITCDKYVYCTSSDSVNLVSPYIWTPSYTTFGKFIYKGKNFVGTIKAITSISYMHQTASEYTIRVFDVTNSTVISENTFSNATEQKIELDIDEDKLPDYEAIIEIQGKSVPSGDNRYAMVYFRSIDVFYYNRNSNSFIF